MSRIIMWVSNITAPICGPIPGAGRTECPSAQSYRPSGRYPSRSREVTGLPSTYAYPFKDAHDSSTPSQESRDNHEPDRESYPRE